ncbi:MAG: hypothetical protein PVF77_18765 [Anaerolineae bacterium]|jgi:hypothetical protein
MKRSLVVITAVLAILLITVAGAYAAPEAAGKVGPYEGRFQGVANGDRSSSAPIMLDLTHRGNQVEGVVYIGEGLVVSGGFCGTVNVPATAQYVEGKTVRWNPNRLVVKPTFDLGGFELKVDFESNVSADGEEITAKAEVDLPWFCGRDPVLSSTLYRE